MATRKTTSTAKVSNQPVAEYREGNIKVALWMNPDNGFVLSTQKGYKPKGSDDWINTTSYLFANEAERMLRCLVMGLARMRKETEGSGRTPQSQQPVDVNRLLSMVEPG